MFCKNCGQEIISSTKFCKNCGYKVKKIKTKIQFSKFLDWIKRNIEAFVFPFIVIIILILVSFFNNADNVVINDTDNASNDSLHALSKTVVNIGCDNDSAGSGTIFRNDGIILTNNHVIAGSTICLITIPDATTGKAIEIYEAKPIIVPGLSKKYDIALLSITGSFTDENGKTWGNYPTEFISFSDPDNCKDINLGDKIIIYGYPVTSGGYNLTVTDGIISSFTDDDNILTSAKIDSGNSGGLAIDQNGCFVGIPSAVIEGNYQNLGVIIPSNIVFDFFNKVLLPSSSSETVSSIIKQAGSLDDIKNIPCENNSIVSNIDGDCITLDQYCKEKNGDYSYYVSSNNSCVCMDGYVYETNKCISYSASCSIEWPNSYWTGKIENNNYICDCKSGYNWNYNRTACIILTKTGYQICSEKYLNATWDGTYNSKGGYNCICKSGYYWDNNQADDSGGCYTSESLNQSCNETYLNTYWDGTYSTKGIFICDCKIGYRWDTTRSYCY